MHTILVVEDERQIAEIASDYLVRAGFAVIVSANGASALDLARSRRPDLIVLDLGLPRIDGLDVAKTLRRESSVPIIMLTARVEESDRLLGLELGADDYITKPFSPRELVARVQAVLRRATNAAQTTDVVRLGDLTLDVPRLKVSRGRHANRADGDRVPAAGHDGAATGPCVHACAAARRGARGGGRVVRPRHRRAREEPPPQARTRSTTPALRADGVRNRLQVRRAMRPYQRPRRPCPPWWPANEPWPPARAQYPWTWGRRFFLFRVGGVMVLALMFGAIGVARLLTLLLERAGVGVPQAGVAAVFLVFLVVLALMFTGMRRVGLPLGDIVSAADRVGRGDFSARLVERGPPFLRSVARAFNTMTVRLEAHERQRRDLMADVAHELRTPLSIMRGRLEGLVDGVYPRDDATLAQLVDETKLLERLVEDLRTLAHAEGGTLKLQREATDLVVLIHEVLRSFASAADAGGVDLRGANVDDVPLVDVDPLRIREVLGNLLSNAIRHSRPGGTVSVSAEAQPDRVIVRVSDTGAGIHPDELPHVFDRFSKGVDSRGSGLGLTIARNLVLAHGGDIKAESRLEEGTTMTFSLPLDASDV